MYSAYKMAKKSVVFILLWNLITRLHASGGSSGDRVRVTCGAGTFIGKVNSLDGARTLYGIAPDDYKVKQFLGIPYAEAPTDERRFKKPIAKAPMTETYDATSYGASCHGLDIVLEGNRKPGGPFKVSEDCLFLNIFVPHPDKAAAADDDVKYPVLMFIHGGGFNIGTSTILPGDILGMYGKVVVVTINYRLNVWGFLSTGDEASPGNYGLWDQHMAIRWVHDNIAAFGGDPYMLTIAGNSAGSASVIYQAMYPGNAGLITRVIGISGSITCPWSFNKDPLNAAKKVGGILGCGAEESHLLVECIKSKPTDEVVKAMNDNAPFVIFPMEFVTVIDGDFIKHSPHELMNHESETGVEERRLLSSYDFMTGVTENDGLMMLSSFVGVHGMEEFTMNREKMENNEIPKIAKIMFGEDASDLVERLIMNEYFPWDDPDNDTRIREEFFRLSGDYVFKIQAVQAANVHSLSGSKRTYFYDFTAMPSQHLLETPAWATTPNHGDDLTFLFGYDNEAGFTSFTMPFTRESPDSWEIEVSKAHITMVTNFVKSGDPNQPTDVTWYTKGAWPRYTASGQEIFRISREKTHDEPTYSHPSARAFVFWYNTLPSVIKAMMSQQDQQTCYKPEL